MKEELILEWRELLSCGVKAIKKRGKGSDLMMRRGVRMTSKPLVFVGMRRDLEAAVQRHFFKDVVDVALDRVGREV